VSLFGIKNIKICIVFCPPRVMNVFCQLIGLEFTTFIPMPMLVRNDGENTKQMLDVRVRTL